MPKLRFRYSLRALLVLMALVSVACYYALLPWSNAYRFVSAVRRGRMQDAQQMLAPYGTAAHAVALDGNYPLRVEPVSLSALWRGQAVIYIDNLPPDLDMPGGTYFLANRSGIMPGPITW